MFVYIPGILGFLLFFIYDWNSITYKNRMLQKGFLLGSLLNVIATFGIIRQSYSGDGMTALNGVFAAITLAALAGLIYTLFFALPFDETYVADNQLRPAYTKKMYALCRHPGVLWYGAFYLCLAGSLSSMTALFQGVFLTLLNVLYILYQDKIVFPRTFSDYEEYKKTTPFLIPTVRSVKACMWDMKKQ